MDQVEHINVFPRINKYNKSNDLPKNEPKDEPKDEPKTSTSEDILKEAPKTKEEELTEKSGSSYRVLIIILAIIVIILIILIIWYVLKDNKKNTPIPDNVINPYESNKKFHNFNKMDPQPIPPRFPEPEGFKLNKQPSKNELLEEMNKLKNQQIPPLEKIPEEIPEEVCEKVENPDNLDQSKEYESYTDNDSIANKKMEEMDEQQLEKISEMAVSSSDGIDDFNEKTQEEMETNKVD